MQQDNKPAPIGAGVEKQQKPVGNPAVELPTESKSFGQQPPQPAPTNVAPTPPVESKPSAAEVKATADSLSTTAAQNNAAEKAAERRAIPTGPKNNRITPAVPMPSALFTKSGPQVTAATATIKPSGDQANGPMSAANLKDATQAAKAAVAVAMAKLANPQAADVPASNGSAMDNLTKKVNEMRMTAPRSTGNGRGRGRGGRYGGPSKVDVPDSDFDFQAGNAKFNKQDLVKEAIAGSPLAEASNGPPTELAQPDEAIPPIAYNKTRSFFDNISSEAKDRADNGGQKPGGREWRGEEQRRNMETFGQGSVDGGYRGGFRGRGRGRGGPRGRGFAPRGRGNGYRQQAAQ